MDPTIEPRGFDKAVRKYFFQDSNFVLLLEGLQHLAQKKYNVMLTDDVKSLIIDIMKWIYKNQNAYLKNNEVNFPGDVVDILNKHVIKLAEQEIQKETASVDINNDAQVQHSATNNGAYETERSMSVSKADITTNYNALLKDRQQDKSIQIAPVSGKDHGFPDFPQSGIRPEFQIPKTDQKVDELIGSTTVDKDKDTEQKYQRLMAQRDEIDQTFHEQNPQSSEINLRNKKGMLSTAKMNTHLPPITEIDETSLSNPSDDGPEKITEQSTTSLKNPHFNDSISGSTALLDGILTDQTDFLYHFEDSDLDNQYVSVASRGSVNLKPKTNIEEDNSFQNTELNMIKKSEPPHQVSTDFDKHLQSLLRDRNAASSTWNPPAQALSVSQLPIIDTFSNTDTNRVDQHHMQWTSMLRSYENGIGSLCGAFEQMQTTFTNFETSLKQMADCVKSSQKRDEKVVDMLQDSVEFFSDQRQEKNRGSIAKQKSQLHRITSLSRNFGQIQPPQNVYRFDFSTERIPTVILNAYVFAPQGSIAVANVSINDETLFTELEWKSRDCAACKLNWSNRDHQQKFSFTFCDVFGASFKPPIDMLPINGIQNSEHSITIELAIKCVGQTSLRAYDKVAFQNIVCDNPLLTDWFQRKTGHEIHVIDNCHFNICTDPDINGTIVNFKNSSAIVLKMQTIITYEFDS